MTSDRSLGTRITSVAAFLLLGALLTVVVPQVSGSAAAADPHSRHRQAVVTITNDAYNPATLAIKHETTVVWVNQDTMTHTVTADNGSFDSGPIAPGKTYAHTFLTEGVSVAYHSSLHPFMHGVVNVVHGQQHGRKRWTDSRGNVYKEHCWGTLRMLYVALRAHSCAALTAMPDGVPML